jgi:arylsulfatase A-like enzyme
VLRAPRAETNEPAVGPNVVLIVMDTVRADHVSSYGYAQPTTPVLDALAKQSLLFEHSFATSNMTLSTHASLLTGQWVRQHGARYAPEPRPLPEGHTTLAETLREHGYRSAAVVSNFGYLGREWGLQRGFDYYDDRTAEPLLGECNVLSLRALLRERAAGFVERRAREAVYRDAAEIRRDVSHALDAVTGGDHPAPVFLFVNFMDAHSPYLPPAPYDTKFPGKLPKFDSDDENDLEREVMQGTRHVSERERAHVLSQYDGGLAYLDHELGALFDELKQRKLWDDTLLVVTGDHGEAFGERDIFGHGSSLYDDQIRVPLIVHAPHMKEGARKPELTSSVDFVPTVLAAAELPARPTLPGRDLLSAPTGGRVIFSEGYPNPYLISWNERWRSPLYGAIAWPYKLIVPEKGQPEAYDLHVDPAEVSPLPANLSMISELRAPLDALRDPTAAHGGSSAPSPKLNDAARDRLRALGYVQ